MSIAEQEHEKNVEAVLGCLFLVLLPAIFAYHGFVLQSLWSWFVTPLGVPPLSLAQAVGLGITVAFLTARVRAQQPKMTAVWAFELVLPAFSLGFGWAVHNWFM